MSQNYVCCAKLSPSRTHRSRRVHRVAARFSQVALVPLGIENDLHVGRMHLTRVFFCASAKFIMTSENC